MSFRLSSWFCLAVAALGLGGLGAWRAEAADPPRSAGPAVSEHANAQANTNAPASAARKDSLKNLEDEINRSLQGFAPNNNSMEGMLPPQMPLPVSPRPAIQNKRLQQLLEQKKDWVYMTPEDLAAAPTVEEMFNLREYSPDGSEKKKLSPVERFYDSLDPQPGNRLKGNLKADPFGSRLHPDRPAGAGSLEDASLPSGIRETGKALRKLLPGANPGDAPARGMFSDMFGPSGTGPSKADLRAYQDNLKRFQEMLNGPSPASGAQPLNALGNAADPMRAPYNPASDPVASVTRNRPTGYDPQLGTANPTYIPNASADINAGVLNAWNPGYAPPKPETPKPPTSPSLIAPHRNGI